MEQNTFFHEGISINNSRRILYTASAFAKSSLLHLQEVGQLQAEHPHSSSRKSLRSYLVFLIISGAGTLTYDDITYPLHEGDCVFIDCQRAYTHATFDRLWQLKWCHFTGPAMPEIYEKYTRRGGQPFFRPSDPGAFSDTLDRLYRLAETPDHVRDMKINEALAHLLTLLMAEGWSPEIQSTALRHQDMVPVREYLNAHFREKITLDQLAEHFYINKFYLMRLFKAQFGLSINTYLQQLRITRAKQLLRFTDKNVELIALECGLGTHSYFTRIFKKVEGITPSQFREQWQQ